MTHQHVGSEAAATGELTGMVTRGPLPWEGGGPPVDRRRLTQPTKVVKAPLAYRLRNGLRMLVTGEAFIPVLVRLVNGLKRLPVIGGAFAGLTILTSELRAHVDRADGTRVDYGVVGRHLVTTAGKNFLAACFPNTNEPEVMKYHGYGTGTTAAAAGDTALQTEFTTQYATDNTRPTGSQSSSTNTYTTAATFTPDSGGTLAVTEHGIFSQAATGGGTLFDRNVFSAINLVAAASNGDSLTTTYTLTIN